MLGNNEVKMKPSSDECPPLFFPFFSITNKLKGVFNEFDMTLVYKNNNKLGDLLGSTKDKKDS